MRITTSVIGVAVLLAAVTTAEARPISQMGTGPACKAPWGEPFGLGETIDLHETDAKGNSVKVTYQCTENGWVKVSRAALGSGTSLIAPSRVLRLP
jgi:hypothetical protein